MFSENMKELSGLNLKFESIIFPKLIQELYKVDCP